MFWSLSVEVTWTSAVSCAFGRVQGGVQEKKFQSKVSVLYMHQAKSMSQSSRSIWIAPVGHIRKYTSTPCTRVGHGLSGDSLSDLLKSAQTSSRGLHTSAPPRPSKRLNLGFGMSGGKWSSYSHHDPDTLQVRQHTAQIYLLERLPQKLYIRCFLMEV
jgi:hypothetical protein